MQSYESATRDQLGFVPNLYATFANSPTALAAGFERAQILDVLTGVTLKTFSNYTNHIADTPLDAQFQQFEWSKSATATVA